MSYRFFLLVGTLTAGVLNAVVAVNSNSVFNFGIALVCFSSFVWLL